MRLRVEFTTEPFDLDEAPEHAVVAREVIETAGLDEVDVGPFGNTAEGGADAVLAAVDTLLRRTLTAGATRVSSRSTSSTRTTGERDRSERVHRGREAAGRRDGRGDDPAGRGRPDDVVLTWEDAAAVAVRLPQLADSLDHILAALERRKGVPLAELDRKAKQEIVRSLEARGAFAVRHGVETVASALGVSRFTVYNYLNREKGA